jgi:hypothetical protein
MCLQMAGLYHCVSGCVVSWQTCQIGIALVLRRVVVVVGCVPFHESIRVTFSKVVLLAGQDRSVREVLFMIWHILYTSRADAQSHSAACEPRVTVSTQSHIQALLSQA